jgi:hypothetical protein
VRVAQPEGQIDLPLAEIQSAKLVLTDELIAASLRRGQKSDTKGETRNVDQGRMD